MMDVLHESAPCFIYKASAVTNKSYLCFVRGISKRTWQAFSIQSRMTLNDQMRETNEESHFVFSSRSKILI